jgi:hypothetical protein
VLGVIIFFLPSLFFFLFPPMHHCGIATGALSTCLSVTQLPSKSVYWVSRFGNRDQAHQQNLSLAANALLVVSRGLVLHVVGWL